MRKFKEINEAMAAAVRYRLENGGSIIRCGTDTEKDPDGNAVATFDSIAVVKNTSLDPKGAGSVRFAYNYQNINP